MSTPSTSQKSAKRLLAFIVETDDPEESVIQFASTNVAARRQGADEIGTDFECVSCKRLPWADEYAGGPIPAKAYIDNGWHVSCTNCGDMVCEGSSSEDEDGNDIAHEPVFRGARVFCCPACATTHEANVAAQNAKFVEFERSVREARPDLHYTAFRGAYPLSTMTGNFTFEGSKYGGSVRDEGDGVLSWYIANGDQEQWARHEAAREEAAA